MISATPAQQRRLLELQQVDTAIRLLEHRRANLPEQKALDENADTLDRVASEYAANRDELSRLELRQTRLEGEVGVVDARRKSEEGRMYSGMITSQKEVEALRGELSSLRARKNELEDELLEVMERREEVESLVATLKDRHSELTAQVEQLTTARDEAATEIDAELTERGQERAAAVADVPEPVLAYYDELRARKDGLAVAELQGRSCSGCHLELTAIELEETRDNAHGALARCAQCGRILITTS